MMTLASSEIMSWLGGFLWPLFRVAALVTAAPIFGARTVPMRVKLVFSLMLTLLIMPILPEMPTVDPISGEAVLITINQLLIGVAMGLSLQLIFGMFVVGGQIIAYQMGLGFATMVDPTSGTSVPVISQFYVIMLTLLFFTLDGHLVFIDVLAESFKTLPVGMNGLSRDGFWQLAVWGGNMYAGAVQIALPAIASLLLINLTFGIVTRAAPQFNIFSLGFPVAIMAGFLIMMLTLDVMSAQIGNQLMAVFEFMRWLVGG